MTDFKKYSSLENHTNQKFVNAVFDYLHTNLLHDTLFVAREKIHGCNFSVIITQDTITPAKRSGPILPDEKFYNYRSIMEKYILNFKEIQKNMFGCNKIQIFGEYAGNGIQKDLDYGEQDFYVFDILIDDRYVSDSVVLNYCNGYGLKIAPCIAKGTLAELLQLPVEFTSIVNEYNAQYEPNKVNANTRIFKTEKAGNIAEGLVIKPVDPLFLNNGSRIAIKYKTDAFKEKGKGKVAQVPVPLTEKDQALLFEFSKYVTPQRISNVASHIGELTPKDFGKLLGLTTKDIFTEAEREGLNIETAEMPGKVKKELQKLVQVEVRQYWTSQDFSFHKVE